MSLFQVVLILYSCICLICICLANFHTVDRATYLLIPPAFAVCMRDSGKNFNLAVKKHLQINLRKNEYILTSMHAALKFLVASRELLSFDLLDEQKFFEFC